MEDSKCLGILLQGPPGTGKILLAISLAKSFNASYYIIKVPKILKELERRKKSLQVYKKVKVYI